jgi:hypothetical protein
MSALPLKTAISDTYPNPSNATARAGFGSLWDVLNEFTEKSEIDVASAATCDIGAQLSTKLRITGTTGITSFGTTYRGPILLRFAGAVTLTHNATTLRCPGAANITTAAGDVLIAWPTATVSGTLDGWQVAVLAYGTTAATWQNLTSSKACNTTYTNSTGRTIVASVAATINSADKWLNFILNGSAVATSSGTYNTGALVSIPGIEVPPGATYSVANSGGTPTLTTWWELR